MMKSRYPGHHSFSRLLTIRTTLGQALSFKDIHATIPGCLPGIRIISRPANHHIYLNNELTVR